MNNIIAIKLSGAKGFPGTNQVMYQTNQVVHQTNQVVRGKWKMLKCGNRSTETEVRKPKCGSEKKSRLSVSSALLTHDCALVGKG